MSRNDDFQLGLGLFVGLAALLIAIDKAPGPDFQANLEWAVTTKIAYGFLAWVGVTSGLDQFYRPGKKRRQKKSLVVAASA